MLAFATPLQCTFAPTVVQPTAMRARVSMSAADGMCASPVAPLAIGQIAWPVGGSGARGKGGGTGVGEGVGDGTLATITTTC